VIHETILLPSHINRPQRSRRLLILIIALLAIVLLCGRTAISYYVESLWFESLGYAGVFWKTLGMQSDL